MRALLFAALSATAVSAAPAYAFDLSSVPTSFRGFRVEGNVGGDRWQALGEHNTKLGFGGTIGFDGVIADRIVVGAEGSYWRAKGFNDVRASGLNGGVVDDKSFEEYGAAFRAGYLVTPKLLIFGKGGLAVNEQRKSFNPTSNLYYVNGAIVGPEQSYYRHENYYGYQAGGGVEYSLTPMFYADVQYVYSNYDTHTSRQRVMGGVGIRFK
jgi:outer membrane immunogenic protein